MSKKYHNRNESAPNQSAQTSSPTPQQPSNVTLGDLEDEAKPKKHLGPPLPEVERQPLARALTEFLLIFAVFFMYGAWPVPDTNEPYYVGKAMHAWHPETFQNDVFYNSHDTHWLFYKSFGWLTLYMGLDLATWIGRTVLWLALAFGWYRLNRVVIGRPWASVISAMIFACFMVKFQMAGEWVIGGIEGKVFAYVFVFLGLDALARNRWNLMWVMFGIAAAYHPVVGGWSVVAGGLAWLLQRRSDRVPLKRMIVPLLIGGAISLIGVIPAIMMNRSPKAETAQQELAPQTPLQETGQQPPMHQPVHHVVQRPVPQYSATQFPATQSQNGMQSSGSAQNNSGMNVPTFDNGNSASPFVSQGSQGNMPQGSGLTFEVPANAEGAIPLPGVASNADLNAETTEPEKTATAKSEHQKIKEKASYIATFKRLSHHQLPYAFRPSWVIRLLLLAVAWLFCAAIVWGRKTIRPDDPQVLPDDEPIIQPPAPAGFRIACFIVGTIMISCAGFIIAYGLRVDIPDESNLPEKAILAAKLLQFYWFRMTDFSIPMGMALCGAAILYRTIERCRGEKYPLEPQWWVKSLGFPALVIGVIYGLAFLYFAKFCPPVYVGMSYELLTLESQTLAYGVVLAFAGFWLFFRRNVETQPDRTPTQPVAMLLLILLLAFGASVPMLLDRMQRRLSPNFPRTVLYPSINNYRSWREMCDWIVENTPEDTVFLVPRRDESFKWYAKRANVSTWKEMPQDAASMVRWDETMNDCYKLNLPEEEMKKINEKFAPLSLCIKTRTQNELMALQKKYGFTYILSEQKPELNLPVVYATEFYILYLADAETLNSQLFPHPEQNIPQSASSLPSLSFSEQSLSSPGLPVSGTAVSISEPVLSQPVNDLPFSNATVPSFRPLN